jgi:hypothetical protein
VPAGRDAVADLHVLRPMAGEPTRASSLRRRCRHARAERARTGSRTQRPNMRPSAPPRLGRSRALRRTQWRRPPRARYERGPRTSSSTAADCQRRRHGLRAPPLCRISALRTGIGTIRASIPSSRAGRPRPQQQGSQ